MPMENAVNFAANFANLVWLLLHEPQRFDDQKAALRALVEASSATRPVYLVLVDNAVTVNSERVPATQRGVTDLAFQMTLHGLAMISFSANSPPAQLLSVARVLASPPVPDDGGEAAEARRMELGATAITFAARPRARDTGSIPLVPQTPTSPVPQQPDTTFRATSTASLPDMEFGDVVDDPFGEAMSRSTPRATRAISASEGRGGKEMFAHFAAPRVPTGTPEQLVQQLQTALEVGTIVFLLEDLAILAEHAARDGKGEVVMFIMSHIGRREPDMEDHDAKRAFVMTLRRLAKPDVLRAVATWMPREPERHGDYMAVLTRAGEDGIDTLVEQLAAVERQRDRRVYYDALIQLKGGTTALLHMLTDSRWYVARNAAELLGEMQVIAAENPMTALLQHEDDRVRRAATGALMRLGTLRAMQAIEKALVDSAPQMRMEAAAALATRKDARHAVLILLKALDAEKDEDVQASFMLALGKLATPEAVQRLMQAAEAERGLFKKKTTAFRVAAVRGLGEARTAEAAKALGVLGGDKDQEVRETANFASGRIARASGRINVP